MILLFVLHLLIIICVAVIVIIHKTSDNFQTIRASEQIFKDIILYHNQYWMDSAN